MDLRKLKTLIDLVSESGISELEVTEGEGKVRMNAGSCWIQPPRIPHRVLDYSDDCEVLEIILPADFETVELE